MKNIFLFVFVSILFLFAYSLVFNSPNLLTYIESSSGLQTVAFEGGRSELEFADINNDGYKDILTVGDHGNPFINTQEHGIMLYFGNGTGANWNLFQNGAFGYGGIAIGDVNNDGKQDVGYGIHHNYSSVDLGDQVFEVALGDGTGMNWTAWDDSLGTNGQTWGMFTTDFADIDNDGKLDVGSISFGCCDGIHVHKNLGTGVWRQTFGFIGGNSTMEFVFGDFNNDGNMDFAAGHQYGTPYFGDGLGNFTLKHNNLPSPGNGGLRGVSKGDVNNDGADELSFIGTGGSVNVWKWNNSAQQWADLSNGLPTSSGYQKTFIYDMNFDGIADLVVYGSGTGTIYLGNGGTTWTSSGSFTVPSSGSYQALTVGDVDNNGYPDIAVLAVSGSINVLRLFKETTQNSSLSLKPVFPKGYERLKNNQVRFIEWISSAPLTPQSLVKLELSTTGNTGPWTLIKDSVKNSGRYQWVVPTGIASSNCYIKYTIYNPGGTYTTTNLNPFMVGILLGTNSNEEINLEYRLEQNYPNPFNPVTKINYALPKSGFISLKVYDLLGREVVNIVNENKAAGNYSVDFNAGRLTSGVYFYRLESNGFVDTKKMMLVK